MTDHSETVWEKDEIESHLKSAMDVLTPNVLDKIDLSTPQEIYLRPSRRGRMYRRMRSVAMAAAACLCVAVLGGGVTFYQNHRIDSVVGIDVNPSIELSVNRNEKVLQANPLNDDAQIILDDMDLKNVDLDIAVNALIGSMVRNGYLDEIDNAILVTVTNDDEKKAASLRKDVVVDVESSLQEHSVQAVVYDQQMKVTDEIQNLSEEYNISYGKAYFLQELIRDNELAEEDMNKFAGMTMEEIAREITKSDYSVGHSKNDDTIATDAALVHEVTLPQTEAETVPEGTEESTEHAAEKEQTAAEKTQAATKQAQTESETAAEDEAETDSSSGKKAKVDYVDYEGGILNVVFKEKVKWKNPTVAVVDEDGQSYSARITDTDGTSCEIHIKGLPGNMECTFTLAGVAVRDGGAFGTIKGYFETPDISDELIDDEDEDEETETSEETRSRETKSETSKDESKTETEQTKTETKQSEKSDEISTE